ncbi:MAG: HIT family protein [Candidatus Thorarchaeota archaeon]|nr:MAG: HIT family protein [Candidatus Thorarchaeota archaeon]
MSQSSDCIFCKIVKGEIPASVVFEDEHVMAFMDIFPIAEGHILLIPKDHYTNMLDIDLELLPHLARRLALLTRQVDKAFNVGGVMNIAANGAGAGQEIPHLHFHVIPRGRDANYGFRFPPGYREEMAPREKLESIAKKIQEAA